MGYIREVYNIMISKNMIEYVDSANIDGSDFTPLVNLAITGANGVIFFLVVVSVVFLAIATVYAVDILSAIEEPI